METLKRILLFMTGICLIIACSKSDQFWGDEPLGNTMKGGHGQPIAVTVPFEINAVGNYTSREIDPTCGPNYKKRIIVDGSGTGTHLGNFIIHFDFCNGPNGYGNTVAYIVAANGDILYVSCKGKVLLGRLEDHPEYVISYWRDPFVILGGTGRFEGASGSGMTDDYNSSEDPYSHHHWRGTITMVKGKQ
jgi:hypothetical protein